MEWTRLANAQDAKETGNSSEKRSVTFLSNKFGVGRVGLSPLMLQPNLFRSLIGGDNFTTKMFGQKPNIHILLTFLSTCGIATVRATMVCTVPKLLPFPGTFLVAFMLAVSPQAHSAEGVTQNLDSRLSVTWQGQELGAVLDRLSTTQGLSVWLDRRIDPQQQVNARHSNATLREVLDQIASDHLLGWCVLDDLIYIGPVESANEMATLAAMVRQSLDTTPADYRNRWLSVEPASWPRLSNPKALLEQWSAEADTKLSNPQVLPHDLWDAHSLTPMSLADRVTLLLIGFDMTLEITPNGRSCQIVPIESPVLITETHNAGSRARQVLAAFKDNKDVEIQNTGRQLTITGRWEDQQHAAEIIAGSRTVKRRQNVPKKVSEQRFSLKLENQQVGKVIDQLAGQLGLNVTWDRQLNPDVKQKLISCEVSNGDLNNLLESVLTPAGLSYRLQSKRLQILPATP
jgi:hypothetical protein